MSDRPRRAVALVNYLEPSDDIEDLFVPESSAETLTDSSGSASGSYSGDSISSLERSVVDEEATAMANQRANQLIAGLAGISFQLEELKEDVDTRLHTMSTKQLSDIAVELRDLRVELVKTNSELNLVTVDRGHEANVTLKKTESKDVLARVKLKYLGGKQRGSKLILTVNCSLRRMRRRSWMARYLHSNGVTMISR